MDTEALQIKPHLNHIHFTHYLKFHIPSLCLVRKRRAGPTFWGDSEAASQENRPELRAVNLSQGRVRYQAVLQVQLVYPSMQQLKAYRVNMSISVLVSTSSFRNCCGVSHYFRERDVSFQKLSRYLTDVEVGHCAMRCHDPHQSVLDVHG